MLDWLAALVAPLNTVLFTLGDDAVSWAELLGFITGAACVALTVRNHLANFPVGIANSALFLVLFATARLWSDSSLQVVYIVLGVVGWWQWVHGGARRGALPVTRAGRAHVAWLLGAVLVATVGLFFLLRAAHDSAPFWDALTTALSLAAQWLLNARKVETWWFWIAADCIYVPLYFVRDLTLTGVVYVLFLGLAVAGLRAWTVAWRVGQRVVEPVATGSAAR